MPQTIQQQRAKFALEAVEADRQRLDARTQSEYRARASELPAMIHMNGLGQAAAFYRSRGEKSEAYNALYGILSRWLTQEAQPYSGAKDLLGGVTQCDQRTYRLAQAEAIALMDWVKKFAKAFMEGEQ